jgi:hypothetical protein
MTRERHLLRHLIFQTNEGDVAVASKQIFFGNVAHLKTIVVKFSKSLKGSRFANDDPMGKFCQVPKI